MRFLIYCSPAFAFAIPTFPVMILLPALYAEKYSLSIASVGVAIFLGKLVDIISDPLMGWITDKGFMKRKSLILIGSIISGLALYLLFVPIINPNFFYLLVCISILYSGWTIFQVPYLSFGYDLVSDYEKRTQLSALREFFILLALSASVAIPFFYNSNLTSEEIIAFLAIISGFISLLLFCIFLKEPKKKTPNKKIRFLTLSKNFVFLRFIAVWFINSLANVFPMILFVFYLTYIIGDSGDTKEKILFYYFLSAIIGMPIWVFLGKFLEKQKVWLISLLLSSFFFVFIFVLNEGDVNYFIIIACLTGICLGADLALPPSMLSDLSDYHKKKFDEDISGFLFSLLTLITKVAFALASIISFTILDQLGLQNINGATDKSKLAIIILYAGVPILLKIIASYFLNSYSITRESLKKIQKNFVT
ncbi:MAG: hypothetical protein CMP33_06820 [Rickettsiales bacterium]|nr:hypothetical protein [Rickettsiales bacterium]